MAEAQFDGGWRITSIILAATILALVLFVLGNRAGAVRATNLSRSNDPVLGWAPYSDDKGSTLRVTPLSKKRISLSFSLVRWGWVGVTKGIPARSLTGTRRLSFQYAGTGAMNTIEFKVLYANGAIFGSKFNHVSNSRGRWRTIVVPYPRFACWPDTGCAAGQLVVPKRIRKIDFAVSNKPDHHDVTGRGSVSFGNVTAAR